MLPDSATLRPVRLVGEIGNSCAECIIITLLAGNLYDACVICHFIASRKCLEELTHRQLFYSIFKGFASFGEI